MIRYLEWWVSEFRKGWRGGWAEAETAKRDRLEAKAKRLTHDR